MEDRKTALFARALMILWEGYCEAQGVVPEGSRGVGRGAGAPQGVCRKVPKRQERSTYEPDTKEPAASYI